MNNRPLVEMADIVRCAGHGFIEHSRRWINWQHQKVLLAIARCRTAALGGHRDRCTGCGHTTTISYNSCRNRHCPRCQGNARRRWLQARERELLPTRYVHAVFTLPRELAPLALQNKRLIYNLLFHASAETLLDAYAPYCSTLEILKRTTPDPEIAVTNFFNALINTGVLTVGLTLRCKECNHSSWHTLNSLAPIVTFPRCLGSVAFPSAAPPNRADWAYKVSGPFAAENFAHGAYCVASTLHFLTEKIVRESTWLPSFRLTNTDSKEIEADFGMFARPDRFSHATSPFLILEAVQKLWRGSTDGICMRLRER